MTQVMKFRKRLKIQGHGRGTGTERMTLGKEEVKK